MTDPHSQSENMNSNSGLQRLRDRTDELELIISSLTIFALFSLPGWLFESFANSYTHLSLALIVGGNLGMTIITGLSYVLGSCFVLHLLVRAYWVGLIGLRTVFPHGINWQRTPGIGPITRAHYQRELPDLEQTIQRADRIASSLFALISLLTLAILWVGLLLALMLAIAGQVGAQFGLTNRFIVITTLVMVGILAGLPALLWLLDSVLGTRLPGLQRSAGFRALIRSLTACIGLIYPQRLILPVQLTLQSNTHPRMFILLLFLGVVAIVLIGNFRVTGWTDFTLSREFHYLGDEALRQNIHSAHYEALRTGKDKLRAWPMIPAFEQSGAFVQLFLPYQPLRDNLLLKQVCAQGPDLPVSADCLQQIWSVRLNDETIALDNFRPAERGDLRMRGLLGLVPASGLQPGLQELVVTWDPSGFTDDLPLDDRYANLNTEYHIPFAFNPAYELSLPKVQVDDPAPQLHTEVP
jgi:hypothetical protein